MTVYNGGNAEVEIYPLVEVRMCPLGPCRHIRVAPGETTEVRIGGTPGPAEIFSIWAEAGSNVDLHWNLRVKDLSRQELTYGTEIPVLSLEEFRPEVTLPRIPLADRFRQSIRISGPELSIAHFVTFTIWDTETGNVILTDQVPVMRSDPTLGHLQIFDLLQAYPQLGEVQSIGIRLKAGSFFGTDEQPRIWAFASITHDETQHVTTITPQP